MIRSIKQIPEKAIKGIFKWIKSIFYGTFKEAKDRISYMSSSPLQNSISLSILAIRLFAITMFVISYITFITNNGFGEQIEFVKSGYSGFRNAFTTGSTSLYMSGFAGFIYSISLVFSLIAVFVALILRKRGMKEVFLLWLNTFLSVFIGLPLLMLLTQNLIPLVVFIIFIAIALFIISLVFGGKGGSSGTSSASNKYERPPEPQPEPKPVKKDETPQPREHKCSGNPKIYVKENFVGYKWIYAENEFGMVKELCSYKGYKNGNDVIMLNGKRVTHL